MPPSARFACCVLLLSAFGAAPSCCAHELSTGSTGAPHTHPETAGVMTTRAGARVLPPTKEDDVFHFVVYGDRTGGVPEGLKVLEQAVTDTNLIDPDLVMTVGDLVQGYNEKPQWLSQMAEYKAIMDRLNMKWFPVAGNHDVYWSGEGPAPQGHNEAIYEEHFGPLWYSFRHKNAGFVVLYSDEGDPQSNLKGFNKGALQEMSDEQLAFLKKALAELQDADHVFVFLHHPRWIGGGYTGGNWETVHQMLKQAGNVSAVFAGHIHHMRYDGPRDGIEHYTLATTGGHLPADIPDAGYLHHLNLVTVRAGRVSVAALPVGSVIDPREFTKEFLADIDRARGIRPIQTGEALILQTDSSLEGELTLRVANPSSRAVSGTISFDPNEQTSRWRTTLDHKHFQLAPGQSRDISATVVRTSGADIGTTLPNMRLQMEYLGDTSRVQLPEVTAPLNIKPGSVPADYFASAEPRCLLVTDEQSAARIDSEDIQIPAGPMTLEAWVRPTELAGFRAIAAKTQDSEYSLFSDEGVPQFSLHLGGRYVTPKAEDKLRTDKWTHLAGVYDGRQVALYVDGKLVAKEPASGDRKFNRLPLYLGADPDQGGVATRAFCGKIDEVRLSKSAVYQKDFSPQRRLSPEPDTVLLQHFDKSLGPFLLDHSSSAATGIMGQTSTLVPVDR